MTKNLQMVVQRHRLLMTLALILFSSNYSWSQINRFIRNYNFSDTQIIGYNYSVQGAFQDCGTQVGCYRGDGPDEYIAAGTYGAIGSDSIFRSQGIHFMHMNHDGKVMQCKPISGGGVGPSSFRIRPDTLYPDQHSVATFTYTNNHKAFIVSQLKKSGTTPRAAINLLLIDNCSGAVTFNKTISSTTRNLYVMDATFVETRDIMMTGYTTDTLGGNKKILYINYNVPTATFKSVEINTTTSSTLPYDFDMGMTVRRIVVDPYSATPMITGSCNSNLGSASLALILNKTSLKVEDIMYLEDSAATVGEYAFDFDEITNPHGYAIYSNKYKQTPDTAGPMGFTPKALYPMVSFIAHDSITNKFTLWNGGTKQRNKLRSSSSMPDTAWAWGTHIDVDYPILSGVVVYKDPNASSCNLNGNTTPSLNQPVNFMSRLSYSWSSGAFNISTSWWKQYHSSMSRYFYSKMGSQTNNMHWPNNFSFHNRYTDSPAVTTDYMLLTTGYNFNTLRGLRTTLGGDINTTTGAYASACSSSVVSCLPNKVNTNMTGGIPNYTRDTLILSVTDAAATFIDDAPYSNNVCTDTATVKWPATAPTGTDYSLWSHLYGRIDWVNTDRYNLYLKNGTTSLGYLQPVANDFYDSSTGTYKVVVSMYSSLANTTWQHTINNARHPDVVVVDDPTSTADSPNYLALVTYEDMTTSNNQINLAEYFVHNPFKITSFYLGMSPTITSIGSSSNPSKCPHIDVAPNQTAGSFPCADLNDYVITWAEDDGGWKVKMRAGTVGGSLGSTVSIAGGENPDVAYVNNSGNLDAHFVYVDASTLKHAQYDVTGSSLVSTQSIESSVTVTGPPRIEGFNRGTVSGDIAWQAVAEIQSGSALQIHSYRSINGLVTTTNYSAIPVLNTSTNTTSISNNPLYNNNGYSPCVAGGNGSNTLNSSGDVGNNSYSIGWYIAGNDYNALSIGKQSVVAADKGYSRVNVSGVAPSIFAGQSNLALANGSNDGAGLVAAWVISSNGNQVVAFDGAHNNFGFKPTIITAPHEGNGWQLWPNPASNLITVERPNTAGEYAITDLSGRMLAEGIINSKAQIPVSHLSPGMYLVQVKSKTGVQIFKFIKK